MDVRLFAYRSPKPAPLLLGYLDRVEASAREFQAEAAELADRVANANEELRVPLDEVPCPELAVCFLICQDRENDVPRRCHLLGARLEKGGKEHGDTTLHVERATSPHVAVNDLSGKGGMTPMLIDCGNDIYMTVQQEWPRLSRARQPCDEIGPIRRTRNDPRLEARRAEKPLDVGDAGGLVPGRIRSVESQKSPEQLGGTLVEGCLGIGHQSSESSPEADLETSKHTSRPPVTTQQGPEAVSLSGFRGDLDSRMLSWGEEMRRCYVETEKES